MAESKDSGGGDFKPFFILLGIIGVLWYFGGGPGRASNNVQNINISNSSNSSISKTQEKIGKTSKLSQYFSLGIASIYSDDPNQEYVEIDVSPNAPKNIQITGLTLKSAVTGTTAIIGKAVDLPDPAAYINESPVFVKPGDRIYVISGKSPAGYSFRTNKCTGYFSQSHQYTPYLNTNCPNPRDNDLPNFDPMHRDACLNYIYSLGGCRIANPDYNTSLSIGPSCVGYATEHFGYSGCVSDHKNDYDFFGHEWYIYLNSKSKIWLKNREFIKLLDANGDTIAYTETY